MSELLNIENLSVGYKMPNNIIKAVRNVNINLKSGEFLGLAGESGCGKSTFAYSIAGLLEYPGEILEGDIKFLGDNLVGMDKNELKNKRWKDFSIVMQASMNVLNPVMRIREQFYDTMKTHLPNKNNEFYKNRTEEMFDLVNISHEYIDAYPHQLSGGMKQRVVIAIALCLKPKLVIMDEPTTALDVVVQRGILQEIDKLRKKLGFSIIFITHDLSLLVEIADSIAIMYAGEIVEKADAKKIYSGPLHPYTKGLISSFPPLMGKRKRLHGISGNPPDLAIVEAGCPFYERCEKRIDGICDIKTPKFLEIKKNHYVSCHLYQEGGEK